jgi:hypothetical protein
MLYKYYDNYNHCTVITNVEAISETFTVTQFEYENAKSLCDFGYYYDFRLIFKKEREFIIYCQFPSYYWYFKWQTQMHEKQGQRLQQLKKQMIEINFENDEEIKQLRQRKFDMAGSKICGGQLV